MILKIYNIYKFNIKYILYNLKFIFINKDGYMNNSVQQNFNPTTQINSILMAEMDHT